MIVTTTPFSGQRPDTPGLRKSVQVFRQSGYLENFLQSLFDVLEHHEGATLRVYLERFEADVQRHGIDAQQALAGFIATAEQLAGIAATTGRTQPTFIT